MVDESQLGDNKPSVKAYQLPLILGIVGIIILIILLLADAE